MTETATRKDMASDSVEAVARRLEPAEIIFRRWIGAWIDFLVLGAIVVGPVFTVDKKFGVAVLLIVVAALLAYFPVTEGLWGRTLGKLVAGTIVVDAEGRRPGLGRAVLRTLMRLVEVNPFLLGGLPAGVMVMVTPDRRRLGDYLAGTYVIPIKSLVRRPAPKLVEAFD